MMSRLFFVVAAAGLAISAPAMARGLDYRDREAVFEFSKSVCRTADRTTTTGKEFVKLLESYAARLGLTLDEQLLLGEYCNLYLQGVVDGLRKARSTP